MKSLSELTQEEKKALVNDILCKDETGDDYPTLVSRYDLQLHPDTLRKASIGVRLATDASSDQDGYGERQKLRDMTAKVNAMYRSESRSELLRQTVFNAVRELIPYDTVDRIPVCSSSYEPDRHMVVCIGDTHFGADIDCRGLYGECINRYNEEVFDSRMTNLMLELIHIIEKEKPVSTTVYLVGDLIDGILRQSQLTRLEYGLVDQVIRFSEYMAGWINDLSKFTAVNVRGVSGNHSQIRPIGSKAREFEEENLEKIIYWFIKSRLESNDRVNVDDTCNRLRVDTVGGYQFMLLHGDGEKKIEDIIRSSVNLYGKPIDFFVCGHYHRMSEFPSGITPDGNSEIIRVPSLCGVDLYAQNKGYGGRAGATVLMVEQGYGCRCKYPIKLG